MQRTPAERWLPMLAIVIGALIIGFAAILSKLAMREGMGTMAVATWRTGLSIPVFCTLLLWTRANSTTVSARSIWWLLIPGVAFALDLLTWHAAFQYTTAGMATLLANVSVILVGIGGWWLLGERVGWRWWLGAFLALLGVVGLMAGSEAISSAPRPVLGNALALITALCYASYLLSARVVRSGHSTIELMTAVVVISTLVLAIATVIKGESWTPNNSTGWWWVILLALGPQITGQGLIIWAVGRVPAALVAVALLLQPVGTAIWGDLFLNEPLRWTDALPGALVLTGIAFARMGSETKSSHNPTN